MLTLREVTGDPEELAALQRVMESDEDYFLRVTGHPPGPADAQGTLMFVPEGASPDGATFYMRCDPDGLIRSVSAATGAVLKTFPSHGATFASWSR